MISHSTYCRCSLGTIIHCWFYQDNEFNTPGIYLVFSGKWGGTQSKMSPSMVHSLACCLSRYISYNLDSGSIYISIWNSIILIIIDIAYIIIIVININTVVFSVANVFDSFCTSCIKYLYWMSVNTQICIVLTYSLMYEKDRHFYYIVILKFRVRLLQNVMLREYLALRGRK